MRFTTSNTTPMPWPAKILSEVQPRAVNFTHCWAKLRCKGERLTPERQPGGVCAACTAPQKSASEIAAAHFANGKPVARPQELKKGCYSTTGIKPLAHTAKANKAERSLRGWVDGKRETFKPAIDDANVPMTSGTLKRLGDTVFVSMRWGNKNIVRAAYLVQCVREQGGCGRPPFYASRSKLARKNLRLSACEHCLPAVQRRNEAKQKKALAERRKAARVEERRAA